MADTRWLNTSGFSGLNDDLLLMIRQAGFQRIDASPTDFPVMAGQPAGQIGAESLQHAGLQLNHLRTLENFPGAPHPGRWHKREELRQRIAFSLLAGCDALLVTPPVTPEVVKAMIDDDLRWLASEAARFHLRLIYQPLTDGCIDNTPAVAWEHLRHLEQPNIGLMIDWLSISAHGSDISWLETIPVEWIYGVQLCDPCDPRVQPAGNASQALNCFTDKLHSIGYRGPVGIVPNPAAGSIAEQITRAFFTLASLWPGNSTVITAGQG